MFNTNITCPLCFAKPLVIEQEIGTLNFFCAWCDGELEPSAEALIQTLKIKENFKEKY